MKEMKDMVSGFMKSLKEVNMKEIGKEDLKVEMENTIIEMALLCMKENGNRVLHMDKEKCTTKMAS